MTAGIETCPIDLIRFVGLEHEQFLVSIVNNPDDLKVINHLQGLFNAAMSYVSTGQNDFVIFQLLTFVHYHFLFSNAALIRCHLSEAFASARAATDAALIAAMIIHDRASQQAYAKREKPFDKLMRYYKNLIRDKKDLPHPLVEPLVALHDKFSMFASHADLASFVHRVTTIEEGSKKTMAVQYFQFAKNKDERSVHAYGLFHTFVMILDVFSDFLVHEQKTVSADWQSELRSLGGEIERRAEALQKHVRETVYKEPPADD